MYCGAGFLKDPCAAHFVHRLFSIFRIVHKDLQLDIFSCILLYCMLLYVYKSELSDRLGLISQRIRPRIRGTI